MHIGCWFHIHTFLALHFNITICFVIFFSGCFYPNSLDVAMPGPTNPWASELKKSRRGNKTSLKGKEQKSSLLQHPDDDDIQHQDDEKSLNETREAAATTTTMEKAVDEVKKYVKVQDDDVAAAEVVGGSKKKDSSPPYSKVNDTQADAPPKRLKKKSDANQQVSRSRCKADADAAVVSKKKVSAKVNDTKTDAPPPKVPKKKTDAINPKDSGASSVSPKKVTSTASKLNDTSVSPKDVVLKKKSDANPNVKPSSTPAQLPNESKDSTLNTNRRGSLNTNRSLYQDARSQLKPVAGILSRQLSQEAKIEVVKVAAADDDETPVDRLIKQGSIEQPKG